VTPCGCHLCEVTTSGGSASTIFILHLAKVFETVVGKQLLVFLEPSLDNNLFGSRKGRSTTHAIVAVLHSWMSCLDSGGSVRTIFVDVRKAFDLVNHNILFNKLQKFGVPGCLLAWFGSYLSNRQQRVRANQSFASWKELKGGMPQGSWLGPLSFLVLIDDLSTGCPVYKYVDDSTLSEALQRHCSSSDMTHFFTNLLDWIAKNDMQLNLSKTKETILGPLAKSNIPPTHCNTRYH